MFMENNYLNEKIQKKVELLIGENKSLEKALESLKNTYINIVLEDIQVINDSYLIKILGNFLNIEAIVLKDGLISQITYLKRPDEVFSNYNRKLFVKDANHYEYLDDKGHNFDIVISFLPNGISSKIINELLDENRSIENIKDIYYAIESCVDLSNVTLSINSKDKENYLYAINNKVLNYLYTYHDGNHTVKEYLGDDYEFYHEEIYVKKLDNSFVKR